MHHSSPEFMAYQAVAIILVVIFVYIIIALVFVIKLLKKQVVKILTRIDNINNRLNIIVNISMDKRSLLLDEYDELYAKVFSVQNPELTEVNSDLVRMREIVRELYKLKTGKELPAISPEEQNELSKALYK